MRSPPQQARRAIRRWSLAGLYTVLLLTACAPRDFDLCDTGRSLVGDDCFPACVGDGDCSASTACVDGACLPPSVTLPGGQLSLRFDQERIVNALDDAQLSGECTSGVPLRIGEVGAAAMLVPCVDDRFTARTPEALTDGIRVYQAVQRASDALRVEAEISWVRAAQPMRLSLDASRLVTFSDRAEFRGDCTAPTEVSVSFEDSQTSAPCSDGRFVFSTPIEMTDATRTYFFEQTNPAGLKTTVEGTWVRDTVPPTLRLDQSFVGNNLDQARFTGGCSDDVTLTVIQHDAGEELVACDAGRFDYTATASTDGIRDFTFRQTRAGTTLTAYANWSREVGVRTLDLPSGSGGLAIGDGVVFVGDSAYSDVDRPLEFIGRVLQFRYQFGQWVEGPEIRDPYATASGQFGQTLAYANDTLVVGADALDHPRVTLFRAAGDGSFEPEELVSLSPGDAEFGAALAFDGALLAVYGIDPSQNSSRVRLYGVEPGGLSTLALIEQPSGGTPSINFGRRLALDSPYLAILGDFDQQQMWRVQPGGTIRDETFVPWSQATAGAPALALSAGTLFTLSNQPVEHAIRSAATGWSTTSLPVDQSGAVGALAGDDLVIRSTSAQQHSQVTAFRREGGVWNQQASYGLEKARRCAIRRPFLACRLDTTPPKLAIVRLPTL